MNTKNSSKNNLTLGIVYKPGFQSFETVSVNSENETNHFVAILSLMPDSRIRLICRQSHSILAKLVSQELGISQQQIELQSSNDCSSREKCCQAIQHLSAVTRCLLTRSAAHLWNISPADCTLRAGKVRQLSKDFHFELGELIGIAKELAIPQHAELRYQHEGLEI